MRVGKVGERLACDIGAPHLVSALCIFLGVVGDADHLGDGDGVEAAEGLRKE